MARSIGYPVTLDVSKVQRLCISVGIPRSIDDAKAIGKVVAQKAKTRDRLYKRIATELVEVIVEDVSELTAGPVCITRYRIRIRRIDERAAATTATATATTATTATATATTATATTTTATTATATTAATAAARRRCWISSPAVVKVTEVVTIGLNERDRIAAGDCPILCVDSCGHWLCAAWMRSL